MTGKSSLYKSGSFHIVYHDGAYVCTRYLFMQI